MDFSRIWTLDLLTVLGFDIYLFHDICQALFDTYFLWIDIY